MRKLPACLHCSDPPVMAAEVNADWLLEEGFQLVLERLDHAAIKANEILCSSSGAKSKIKHFGNRDPARIYELRRCRRRFNDEACTNFAPCSSRTCTCMSTRFHHVLRGLKSKGCHSKWFIKPKKKKKRQVPVKFIILEVYLQLPTIEMFHKIWTWVVNL